MRRGEHAGEGAGDSGGTVPGWWVRDLKDAGWDFVVVLWMVPGGEFWNFWKAVFGPLLGLLGASWGRLGASWVVFGGLLESPGGPRGRKSRIIGSSSLSWPSFGPVLGLSWAVSGAFWAVLGPAWAELWLSGRPLGPS